MHRTILKHRHLATVSRGITRSDIVEDKLALTAFRSDAEVLAHIVSSMRRLLRFGHVVVRVWHTDVVVTLATCYCVLRSTLAVQELV